MFVELTFQKYDVLVRIEALQILFIYVINRQPKIEINYAFSECYCMKCNKDKFHLLIFRYMRQEIWAKTKFRNRLLLDYMSNHRFKSDTG